MSRLDIGLLISVASSICLGISYTVFPLISYMFFLYNHYRCIFIFITDLSWFVKIILSFLSLHSSKIKILSYIPYCVYKVPILFFSQVSTDFISIRLFLWMHGRLFLHSVFKPENTIMYPGYHFRNLQMNWYDIPWSYHESRLWRQA